MLMTARSLVEHVAQSKGLSEGHGVRKEKTENMRIISRIYIADLRIATEKGEGEGEMKVLQRCHGRSAKRSVGE